MDIDWDDIRAEASNQLASDISAFPMDGPITLSVVAMNRTGGYQTFLPLPDGYELVIGHADGSIIFTTRRTS